MTTKLSLRDKQQTIRHPVTLSGVGLHSGQMTTMRLLPAKPNHGVVFRRVDSKTPVDIPAHMAYVGCTRLCTTLENGGQKVATVEHFLSAVTGLGVDNLLVEIDGPEVPIMDGSASPFVFALQSAGIITQQMMRRAIVIKEPIEVRDDASDAYCKLEPYQGFTLDFSINFKHPSFTHDNQTARLDMRRGSYAVDVSRARTFGFVEEMAYLRKNNLARGASLKNAVGLSQDGVMNEDGLRYRDECVKHKILDAVGDLSLLGSAIIGAFTGNCSGHRMNKMLLDRLMAQTYAWEAAPAE